MQSSKYYDTMFHVKKEVTKSNLILYLSFILVTWSLLQISLTDFLENNDNILMKLPSIYAQGDGGENGEGEVSYDNWDIDIQEQSLDKEDTQDNVPGELTLSEDGSQDESVDFSRLIGTDPSQLPFGDPQPLLVALPPLPGGPSPPGALPPIPGSPLPPGSPIPPGGGPTPPEDLQSLDEELRPLDDSHNDNEDDDENEDEDDAEEEEENEDKDEGNDDKDNN